jgi:hypothetical protein
MTEPTPLEQAKTLLAAASHTDGDLRAYYAAKARLMFDRAVAELEALRVNLQSVESTLPGGEKR